MTLRIHRLEEGADRGCREVQRSDQERCHLGASDGIARTVQGPVQSATQGDEDGDDRRVIVNVAGPAALLVAKAFKLGERLMTPERLIAKDAGDVYRLFDMTSVADMAQTTKLLLGDDRSEATTRRALGYVRKLFATPRSPGVELAIRALASVIDETTVAAVMTGYTRELIELISE